MRAFAAAHWLRMSLVINLSGVFGAVNNPLGVLFAGNTLKTKGKNR
jgi:hypothetical protein